MTPTLNGNPLLVTAFWVLLFPVAAFLLRVACSVCGEDPPSWRRSFIGLLVVSAGAYFAWDLSSYLFMLMMRDDTVGVRLPPGYSYWKWLREPVGLKWAVLGIVPGVRFIPVLVAIVVAGVLQVGVLEVPFRNAFAITLLQGAMSLVAMAVLAFLLTATRGYLGQVARPEGAAGPPAEAPPGPLAELQGKHVAGGARLPPWLGEVRDGLESARLRLAPYLGPIEEAAGPYTKCLPEPAQQFLKEGGWWLVLAALALLVVLWLRTTWRRLRRALRHPRKRHKKAGPRRIDLNEVTEGYTEPGPHVVAVKDLPARLRVVVLAPAGKDVTDLDVQIAGPLLEWVKPGLGEVLEADGPRVRVWPPQYSDEGFARTFFERVPIPEPAGQRSHWVLLAGPLTLGRQRFHVGLALYAEEANRLRTLALAREPQWADVLSLVVPTEV
jgi:hypothetical protein